MQNLTSHNSFAMGDSSWRIDPSKLPQRVSFRIPAVVYERLEWISARTGRPLQELAENLICLSVDC